jgi:hypothetical protein
MVLRADPRQREVGLARFVTNSGWFPVSSAGRRPPPASRLSWRFKDIARTAAAAFGPCTKLCPIWDKVWSSGLGLPSARVARRFSPSSSLWATRGVICRGSRFGTGIARAYIFRQAWAPRAVRTVLTSDQYWQHSPRTSLRCCRIGLTFCISVLETLAPLVVRGSGRT